MAVPHCPIGDLTSTAKPQSAATNWRTKRLGFVHKALKRPKLSMPLHFEESIRLDLPTMKKDDTPEREVGLNNVKFYFEAEITKIEIAHHN